MAPPVIPIDFNGSAYRNAPVHYQNRASHAWYFISLGQPEHALQSLNELLADRALDSNPLIIETYMMLGKIALDRQQFAEACVDFQLAGDPHMVTCARRGPDRENLAIYEANEAMIKYLQGIISKPRMLGRPSRKFENEFDFKNCHTDTLRGWAYGQHMVMPALSDPSRISSLRTTLKERFSPHNGGYLLIPPAGEPYTIAHSSALTTFGPRGGTKNGLRKGISIHSHCIYHDELLERFMGNSAGWPEGHFFRLYEAIMHKQTRAIILSQKLQPNPLATALLHWNEEIYGPVLVQMCYLLKHRDTRKSVIAVRKPLELDFLRGAAWREMRMEYRALIRSWGEDGVPVGREELDMQSASSARYHIHAEPSG